MPISHEIIIAAACRAFADLNCNVKIETGSSTAFLKIESRVFTICSAFGIEESWTENDLDEMIQLAFFSTYRNVMAGRYKFRPEPLPADGNEYPARVEVIKVSREEVSGL